MANPEVDLDRLKIQMNYEQAQAMKLANLMSLLSSIREFNGDARSLECFIQRMDQVQVLIESAKLEDAGNKSLQGFMMSKIELGLLLDLGLSFASKWEEAKHRLKERYRSATKTAGRVAWRMARMRLEATETLVGFSRRLGDALRQTRDRVAESGDEANTAAVKLVVYEELAMETLLNELPERLKATARAGKPKSLEDLVQIVREEELDREEKRDLRIKSERRTYAEVSRNQRPAVRVETRNNRWRQEYRVKPIRSEETPRGGRNVESWGKGASRVQCWECGSEGHLARNCRYRQARRQRRDEYQPRRSEMVEPMEVNAIGRARVQRQTEGESRRRVASESSRSESGSSDDERISISGQGTGLSEGEEPGDRAAWSVMHHGRPWRRRKTLKAE